MSVPDNVKAALDQTPNSKEMLQQFNLEFGMQMLALINKHFPDGFPMGLIMGAILRNIGLLMSVVFERPELREAWSQHVDEFQRKHFES